MHESADEMVDPRSLRNAMGRFATGVCVLTVNVGRELHGMTLNSLTSVSLHPPLILVCLANGTRTERAVRARGAFVINVLRYEQLDLANRFARPGEDHFKDLAILWDERGLPLLPECLAYVMGRVEEIRAAGDHQIVIARVVGLKCGEGRPLLFFRGQYREIGSGNVPAEYWYW
ncbi:flavin reductase family protein [Pyrinomonas methylaliphatogenes]|jgi:flavin reductase (DIM6/NTAB) family NADH-FMN oxidoreductase RutF|uniref:Conserved protein of DIM6/NTAB family n=1 Tax=Pyrinomonas methylaliphatogenes TaxID=454194 RepID=A0A0B6WWQ1_9BACT|nr:flavin reductase family protein [Pyrinomonas methylaliphatogenes]MBX5480103.1 flavin reductase family protein [Pyrinomonas methylaliphatogenes]CDM65167.1 conserved protein of DIM6/NTAB family [Pyrinomonas methylaliphatogenes]